MVIIAGGIDLSVGSIICLTSRDHQLPDDDAGVRHRARGDPSRIVLAIVIGVGQGAVIARIGVPPFVVTLGSMLLLRGVAEVLTGGSEIGFQGKFPGFRFLGEGIGLGLPMPFWFALGAVAMVAFVMHRTMFGRYCYAIGSNAEAARLSGVPVRAVRLATFVASAFSPASPASSTSRICRPRRRRSGTRTSCTPSRRPCSAAARCRAGAARYSAC